MRLLEVPTRCSSLALIFPIWVSVMIGCSGDDASGPATNGQGTSADSAEKAAKSSGMSDRFKAMADAHAKQLAEQKKADAERKKAKIAKREARLKQDRDESTNIPEIPPLDGFQNISLSRDGQLFAIAGRNTSVFIHRSDTRERIHEVAYDGFDGSFRMVEFVGQPNENKIAIAALFERSIEVRDFKTGAVISKIVPSETEDFVLSMDTNPDGTHLAIVTGEATGRSRRDTVLRPHLTIWDTTTFQRVSSLPLDITHATSVVYSNDGSRLAISANRFSLDTFTFTGKTLVVDAERNELIKTITNPHGPSDAVAFSPDGNSLAIGERTGPHDMKISDQVRIVDLESYETKQFLRGPTRLITSLRYSSDGQHLVAGSADQRIRIWDLNDGSIRFLAPRRKAMGENARVDIAADMLAATLGNSAFVFKLSELQSMTRDTDYGGIIRPQTDIKALQFSDDGKTLATTNQASIRRWDTGQWKLLPEDSVVTGVQAFAGDNETVAGSGLRVVVWKLGGDESKVWMGVEDLPIASAFSPDGQLLATVFQEGDIRVYHVKSDRLWKVGHSKKYTNILLFSPDSQSLLTGSTTGYIQGRITVWDVSDHENVPPHKIETLGTTAPMPTVIDHNAKTDEEKNLLKETVDKWMAKDQRRMFGVPVELKPALSLLPSLETSNPEGKAKLSRCIRVNLNASPRI